MIEKSSATTPITDDIFKLTLGIFVDPNLVSMPYNDKEKKLLNMLKSADPILAEADAVDLELCKSVYPVLSAFLFGGLTLLYLRVLDKHFVSTLSKTKTEITEKMTNEPTNNAISTKGKHSKQVHDASNSVISTKGKYSKHTHKPSQSNSRSYNAKKNFDYLKASQELGKDMPKVAQIGWSPRANVFRYLSLFSLFFSAGYVYSFCRYRITLHNYTKKYDDKLND